MGPTTTKLMDFFASVGKVDGRTKLQRIVFILQEKGIDFNLSYKYALLGPFSQDLQLEVDFLVDIGFIKEEGSPNYVYVLTNSKNIDLPPNDDIAKYQDLINFLIDKEPQLLEITSTIYFLKNKHYSTKQLISEKIKTLKPELKNCIPEAFDLYMSLEEKFQFPSVESTSLPD